MRDIKALVLAPMDKSYEPIREVVQRTLKERSVQLSPLEEILKPGAVWTNAVTDAIQEADLIIADVSRRNPSVLYELGYAHALRKPTLLLLSVNEVSKLPSDLASYQMVIYDPQNLTALQVQIAHFIDYQQSRRVPQL